MNLNKAEKESSHSENSRDNNSEHLPNEISPLDELRTKFNRENHIETFWGKIHLYKISPRPKYFRFPQKCSHGKSW